MEIKDFKSSPEKRYSCAVVVDGKESDMIYPVDLPERILTEGGKKLGGGRYYIYIPDGSIEDGKVIIPNPDTVILEILPIV